MKFYIKIAIAFFSLLFGVVVLMDYFTIQKKPKQFLLIDKIEESGIALHADLSEVFQDLDTYSKVSDLNLGERIIYNQVKYEFLKSGLNINKVFVTFNPVQSESFSFYAEIRDHEMFQKTFQRLTKMFDLKSAEVPFFYSSPNASVSIEKHQKYIKVNFGKNAGNLTPKKVTDASPLIKELLKNPGIGVINTTGTPQLDSNDYAVFSYEYNEHYHLNVEWKVKSGHPLQPKESTLPTYSSVKDNIVAYTNIDLHKFHQNLNPYLKEKGLVFLKNQSQATQDFLALWNGIASLQIGGKTTSKTIEFVTEFDDDFIQIEKKIVKIDSLPDLGFYWETQDPKKSMDLLLKMPNVKLHEKQLQLALFPPLNVQLDQKAIKAASKPSNYVSSSSAYILYLNSNHNIAEGNLKIKSVSKELVQLEFTLNNPTIPKKSSLPSFW